MITVSAKTIGVNAIFRGIKLAPTQVRFGRHAVSVRRVSHAAILLEIV